MYFTNVRKAEEVSGAGWGRAGEQRLGLNGAQGRKLGLYRMGREAHFDLMRPYPFPCQKCPTVQAGTYREVFLSHLLELSSGASGSCFLQSPDSTSHFFWVLLDLCVLKASDALGALHVLGLSQHHPIFVPSSAVFSLL